MPVFIVFIAFFGQPYVLNSPLSPGAESSVPGPGHLPGCRAALRIMGKPRLAWALSLARRAG